MADEVGTLKIKLEFDSKGLDIGAGKNLGNSFGSAWTVAAGALIASGLQKIASTAISVGKDIIQTGMNYEKAMSEVKAISGATADEMERLSQKGIQSASTSVFTTEQVAEAYKYMGMAGWDAGKMIDGLDGILSLAAASNLDLGRTSDIVTDALTAFGYQASESAHFADVLAVAATSSNTNVDLLGESFKYAGALAGTMKYSIEDVGVAMGLMANAGIKASQSGTSFRGMITRMAKPTDEVAKVMDNLGISLYNTDGSARPLNEVMVNLRSSFAGLTDAEKTAAATTLAGKNALSGFLAIVNASDEDFAKLTEAMNNAEGAAQNMADTMLDNLAGAIAMVKSSWNSAVTALYNGDMDGFVQYLGQAFDGITSIVDKGASAIADILPSAMAEISKRLPALASSLGTALGKLVPALLKGLAKMLPDLIKGVMKMATSLMDELTKQLPTLLPELIQGIVDAIIELTNPDNLVTLIDAALNILLALTQGIINSLPVLIDAVPVIISNLVVALIEAAPMIVKAGIQLLTSLVTGIVSILPKMATLGLDIVLRLVGAIMDAAPEILKAGVDIIVELVNGIVSLWDSLQETAKKIPEEIINKVKNALPELLQKGSEMLTKLVAGIKAVWNKITTVAKDIFNTVVNKVAEMPGNLLKKGSEMLTRLVDGIKGVISKLKAVAKDIFNTIVDKVKEIPGKMVSIGKNIVEGLWNGINDKIQWVKDQVSGFANSITDAIKNALGIQSPSKVMRNQVGANIAKGVIEGVNKEMPKIRNNAVKLSNAYVTTAKSRIKEMKSANQITLTQEVSFWQKIVNACKKGTKAYNSAVSQLKKTKAQISNSVKSLTSGYIKDVAGVYSQLDKDITAVKDKLASDIGRLEKQYSDAVSSRQSSIMGQVGLFSAVKFDEKVDGATLVKNLQGQVGAYQEWSDTLTSLEMKVGKRALLDELQGMGVSSLKTLQSLNEMSDDELQTYISLYEQKSIIAHDRAVQENAELRAAVDAQISALQTEAKEQIEELQKAAKESLAELAKNWKAGLKELGVVAGKNSKEVGKQIAKGINAALKAEMPNVQAGLVKQVNAMVAAAKKALKIKSPSRVFRDEVGQMMAEGLSIGFIEGIRGVTSDMVDATAATTAAVSATPSWSGELSSLMNEYDGEIGLSGGIRIDKQVFNINSELDADDMGRRVVQSMRRAI